MESGTVRSCPSSQSYLDGVTNGKWQETKVPLLIPTQLLINVLSVVMESKTKDMVS